MTALERIEKISNENGFFGMLEDFVEACEDEGLAVLEINDEYAVVEPEDDDDDQICVRFGGTSRSITIVHIEEL